MESPKDATLLRRGGGGASEEAAILLQGNVEGEEGMWSVLPISSLTTAWREWEDSCWGLKQNRDAFKKEEGTPLPPLIS